MKNKLQCNRNRHWNHLKETKVIIRFEVQYDLQEMMQELVGIVRNEEEMLKCKRTFEKLMSQRPQM